MTEENLSSADENSAPSPTDPYVIYQLRKPSQRGTAVIPRYVPNTHAPAFSPANYRFARVWPQDDPGTIASSSLFAHAPRSFEYAGSLGSESSIWSDTSSWVSVSSLRTAPSEVRTPLLHQPTAPVSAATFFNDDFGNHSINQPGRPASHRSSDLGSSARGSFRYPPALSESISEDAVVDDLLSQRGTPPRHSPTRTPINPRENSASDKHSSSRPSDREQDRERVRRESSVNRTSGRAAQHQANPPTRSSFLPALTRKRRSFWQWLFCSDHHAHSSVASIKPVASNGERNSKRPSPQNSQVEASNTRQAKSTLPGGGGGQDRVPNADKDFMERGRRARDAADVDKQKGKSRRSPSFEIRRGKPNSSWTKRSLSWSLVPRALLGLDKDKDAKKKKAKDKTRGIPPENIDDVRKLNHVENPKTSSRKDPDLKKDDAKRSRARSQRTQHQSKHSKGSDGQHSRDEETGRKDRSQKSKHKSASKPGVRPKRNSEKPREEHLRDSHVREHLPREEHSRGDRSGQNQAREEQVRNQARENQVRENQVRENQVRENQVRENRPYDSHFRENPNDHGRESYGREDRPRETRCPTPTVGIRSNGPVRKEFVPSLKEREKTVSSTVQTKRMRSSEMSDPNSSRVSSDLSGRTGTNSEHSNPNAANGKFNIPGHGLDPVVDGVPSDVSSHVSANNANLSSSMRQTTQARSASPEADATNSGGSVPVRPALFMFPSSSSDSSAFFDAQSQATSWESPAATFADTAGVRRVAGTNTGAPERSGGRSRLPDSVARAMEKNRARSAGGPLSYLMKHHETEAEINTGSTGLTSLADESVSTHKTVSAVDEEHQHHYGPYASRSMKSSYREGASDETQHSKFSEQTFDVEAGGERRPIFQNSVLFSHSPRSPRSSGASPRRFHSDWSDPHATDIDVYCQCNCSCVYEEECRRSCELIYGRSPSVSSSRSCGRKGNSGFKSLPPAVGTNGAKGRLSHMQVDAMGVAEEEPNALIDDGRSGSARREVYSKPDKMFIRAHAVDELPDVPPAERRSAVRMQPGQEVRESQVLSHPPLQSHGDGIGNAERRRGSTSLQVPPVISASESVKTHLRQRVEYNQYGTVDHVGPVVEERSQARSSTPRPTFVAQNGVLKRVEGVNGSQNYESIPVEKYAPYDSRLQMEENPTTQAPQRRKGRNDLPRSSPPRDHSDNWELPKRPVEARAALKNGERKHGRSRSGLDTQKRSSPRENQPAPNHERRKPNPLDIRTKSPIPSGAPLPRLNPKDEQERYRTRGSRRDVKVSQRSRPGLFGKF